jgi:hypothetical protein
MTQMKSSTKHSPSRSGETRFVITRAFRSERSQERFEFINSQTSMTNYASQRTLCYFFVVRNDDATMRICRLSENHVTAALAILFVAEFG